MLSSIIFTKFGVNRGIKRIWLETKKLADAGFCSGKFYSVQADKKENTLTIVLNNSGNYVVSKRTRKDKVTPIIDINNKSIIDILGSQTEKLKVSIFTDRIVITIHPNEKDRIEREKLLSEKISSGGALLSGSISTGLGVLDHAIKTGLKKVGIQSKLAFGIEIEPAYMEASLANNPIWDKDSISIIGPMQDVRKEDIQKVQILCAGIPCQGASKAGKSRNKLKAAEEHKDVGHLFYSFLNIVKWANSPIIVLENVPDYKGELSYTVIKNVLLEWGYNINETILNGTDFGSLEKRKRFVMVAVSKGLNFDLNAIKKEPHAELTIGDILEQIDPKDDSWSEYEYLRSKEQLDIKNGKGFRMAIYDDSATNVNTIPKHYAKVQSTNPLLQNPNYSNLLRLFTPLEHARIKTIPESFISGLSKTIGHQLLGQSVIYNSFIAVGEAIGKCITGIHKVESIVNNNVVVDKALFNNDSQQLSLL